MGSKTHGKLIIPMEQLKQLFDNNRRWVAQLTARDPGFFQRLSHLQQPQYLWIGCADSRVPANEIVGLLPGELFVHRNISNVVAVGDTNCLSVLQYAVDVLQVRHVIVCGHYGCGGIEATLQDRKLGLADQWLKNVQEVRAKHWDQLSGMKKVLQFNRLCELNVIEQVLHVTETSIIQNAWSASSASVCMAGSMGLKMAFCGISASAFPGPAKRKSVIRPPSIVLSKQPDSPLHRPCNDTSILIASSPHETDSNCIIGTGFMGRVHLEAVRRLGFVEVAAIAGRRIDAARSMAEAFHVERVESHYDRILADPEIQAIHICTPNSLHAPIAKAALAAGKHVLCEKPLAMSTKEAQEIETLAREEPSQLHLPQPSLLPDGSTDAQHA